MAPNTTTRPFEAHDNSNVDVTARPGMVGRLLAAFPGHGGSGALPVLAFAALCLFSRPVSPSRAGEAGPAVPEPGSSPPVAWVGKDPVGADELKRYLALRPVAAPPEQFSPEVRKRLDDLLTFELLYREAIRQGIDRLPDLRRTIREMTVQRLLDERVGKPAQVRPMTEEEIKKYYDAHLSDYVRAEQVRLADIFLAVPPAADAAAREARKKVAQDLLGQALALKDRRFGFSDLIQKQSDTHPLYQKGDTGFFDRDGKPQGLPASLVEAGFGMASNGVVLDRLVEEPGGFHIIMRTGKRAAENRTLQAARPEIEARLRRDERRRLQDELVQRLRSETPPRIEEENLKGVIGQMEKSAGGQMGPPPLPQGPP